jgi:Na+/H+ antiporter NhaD/arsenite permease-like protein
MFFFERTIALRVERTKNENPAFSAIYRMSLSVFPSLLASIHPANYGASSRRRKGSAGKIGGGDRRVFFACIAFVTTLIAAFSAGAAEIGTSLSGGALSLLWVIPFVGMLLSIAVVPLIAPRLWEHHFGAVSLAWIVAILIPLGVVFGVGTAWNELVHTFLVEYMPFMILLFALFVVAGGIAVTGNLVGTPRTNVSLLTFGTALASVIGTTGASMLLIRPMIRANQHRRRKVHIFVLFIFLVSNIGGALTPLGDPPLFLGFLKGVDFFWTVVHMLPATLLSCGVLLALFYAIDEYLWRSERHPRPQRGINQIQIRGLHNVLYLSAVVAAVLVSGAWNSGVSFQIGDSERRLEGLLRDAVLLLISYLSWRSTRASIRIENAFTWKPIQEVAILFAAIFVTMIPALAILRAGASGAAAPLVELVSVDGTPVNAVYFWLTGILSSFLDNAPTYLVFFNLAGGDAQQLMGPLSNTLLAISMGAVFMGANTYIGNAPNFMVKSICEERGIRMPSFFGYMAWSGAILVPLFLALTWLFFR